MMFGTLTRAAPLKPRASPSGMATASTITWAGTGLRAGTAAFRYGKAIRIARLITPTVAIVGSIFPNAWGSEMITRIGVQSGGGLGIPSIGKRDLARIVMPIAASIP